ncbi:hypothetical protein SAMN04488089_101328 [Myroides profundi]|uniref:Uncharacterized protein n=1 Tax=Myroides profundi TaxID=480520 RepID=A0AAJ4W1B7_MYRPR|nr:hypothetical protein SAMN04488089_101328 [Myroides profundi]
MSCITWRGFVIHAFIYFDTQNIASLLASVSLQPMPWVTWREFVLRDFTYCDTKNIASLHASVDLHPMPCITWRGFVRDVFTYFDTQNIASLLASVDMQPMPWVTWSGFAVVDTSLPIIPICSLVDRLVIGLFIALFSRAHAHHMPTTSRPPPKKH